MSETFLESPLAADEVLRRLDARAKDWRESRLPELMRDGGFFGVQLRREGAEFQLKAEGGGRRPWVSVLRGRVESLPSGGSRISGSFRPSAWTAISLGLFGVMGLTIMIAGRMFGFLVMIGIFAALIVPMVTREQDGLRAWLAEAVRSDPAGTTPDAPRSASSSGTG